MCGGRLWGATTQRIALAPPWQPAHHLYPPTGDSVSSLNHALTTAPSSPTHQPPSMSARLRERRRPLRTRPTQSLRTQRTLHHLLALHVPLQVLVLLRPSVVDRRFHLLQTRLQELLAVLLVPLLRDTVTAHDAATGHGCVGVSVGVVRCREGQGKRAIGLPLTLKQNGPSI